MNLPGVALVQVCDNCHYREFKDKGYSRPCSQCTRKGLTRSRWVPDVETSRKLGELISPRRDRAALVLRAARRKKKQQQDES